MAERTASIAELEPRRFMLGVGILIPT